MIGYYLFVCMIYVIVIFLVYMGHCCFYSIDILILNYVMIQLLVAYDTCFMVSDTQ